MDDLDLTALSAFLNRTDYNVRLGEPGYGATEPRDAEPCRCDPPGIYREDGDLRCWKCGAEPATACRS